MTPRHTRWLAYLAIYLVSVSVLLASLVTISAKMRYIVNRDPSYYWDRAYDLSVLLRDDGVLSWVKAVIFSLGSDHTHLPAAIPSLVFHIFSSDSMLVYGTTIIAFYLAPIPVAAALLSVDRKDERAPADILVAGLVALAIMYPFAIRLMPTMPDFGGNLFITLALVLAAGMIVRTDPAAPATFRTLVLPVLAILALYLAAVLFRRWYGFAAVGLLGSYTLTLLVLAYAARGRDRAWSLLKVLVGIGVVFAVLSAPVLGAKVASFVRGGIFTGAYDAYRTNYLLTLRVFGPADLAAFMLLVATALVVHRRASGVFLLATLLANAFAVLVFFHIQAPGIHHFSLLWPILVVSSAVILSRIANGPYRTLGLLACVLAAALFIAWHVPTRPRVDRHYAAYEAIAQRIRTLGIPDGGVCPLGSKYVHHSMIDNLWQISGGRRGDMPRGIWILEVDFGQADGYGSKLHDILSKCQWIISTDALHLHHEPQYHRILRYHHERLLDPDSLIGRAYELKETVELGFPSPVTFYQRKPGSVLDAEALRADYETWLARDKVAFP